MLATVAAVSALLAPARRDVVWKEVTMRLLGRFGCVVVACALVACGDDNPAKKDTDAGADSEVGPEDVDTTETSVEETTATETTDDTVDAETTLPAFAALHVWTGDGLTVRARFDAPLDATSAAASGVLTLVGNDDSAATITGVSVSGNDLTITVSPALSTTTTWDLVATGLASTDGKSLSATLPVKATLFLNMVWHQHQPSYLDPGVDELQGPWVRKHAQKDYFDMTAMLADHPKIHLNVNLTSSLLTQLQRYVEALAPHVDVAADTVDEAAFLAASGGHTDPWVDLLLKDTPEVAAMTELEESRYWSGVWSMKSIAEPLRERFPEYKALLARDGATYTRLDLALLKVWFEVAWMDPSFLRGPVVVYKDGATDVVVDLSDVVDEDGAGLFRLASTYTDTSVPEATRLARLEELANRLVAEQYAIMKGVFEVHKTLGWTGTSGQVEVLTTPFFHPILPLLFDTDLAAEGRPADPLPDPAFAYPGDAQLQIAMAVEYYGRTFGRPPRGMWPSEGSVAEEVVPAFLANGIDWIATDRKVLDRGKPGASHLVPYMIDGDTVAGAGGGSDDEMMIVFRDTEISDKVGFFYQSNPPAENVADFVTSVLGKAGRYGEPSRLLSVILDGENAWEWYSQDHDAKLFLEGLYDALEAAYDERAIVTVTGSEHIDGNAARGVPAHPVSGLAEYEDLFPASWIGGSLDTWIGEPEENLAWVYLKKARDDLEAAKAQLVPELGMPTSYLDEPTSGATAIAWWRAWRNVLSAEGSDWFWWYGSDQTAAGGDDTPFDEIFRAQLRAAYAELNTALVGEGFEAIEVPAFAPILQPAPVPMTGPFGTLPVLDGELLPDESEWVPPGGVFYDTDSGGAQANPADDIARVFYGHNRLEKGRIFVGIDLREDLHAKLGSDYQLVIYTNHGHMNGEQLVKDPFNTVTKEGDSILFGSGGPARRIAVDFSGAAPVATLEKADGAGGWTAMTSAIQVGGPVVGKKVLELRFLLTELGMEIGDPLELVVVAVEGGDTVDVAPNIGTQIVFADPTRVVTVIFELDVSGDDIPISEYVSIADPPPPAGAGVPSIVGNDRIQTPSWTPNTVALKDDGVAPDKAAGDGLWTLAFTMQPGADVQYKYTIGHPGDSWAGTEEYPLTNRGFTVPVDGTRRVRVHDVFADRPDPSGSMAAKTTVTAEEE